MRLQIESVLIQCEYKYLDLKTNVFRLKDSFFLQRERLQCVMNDSKLLKYASF